MKKQFAILLLLLASSVILYAQDFKIPDYKFTKEKDYSPYNQDIVDCVDWLLSTPLGAQMAKRQQANRFLADWSFGNPYLHILFLPDLAPIRDQSSELFLIYMGGWNRAVILWRKAEGIADVPHAVAETPKEEIITGVLGGLKAVNEIYTKYKVVLQESKEVEKFVKMETQGKLEKYVRSKIDDIYPKMQKAAAN